MNYIPCASSGTGMPDGCPADRVGAGGRDCFISGYIKEYILVFVLFVGQTPYLTFCQSHQGLKNKFHKV